MISRLYILFLVLLVSGGCRSKSPDRQDTLNSGVIKIAVDETLYPLMDAELTVFESLTPAAGIVPEYVSETDAINKLLLDSVRLVLATRPLTEEEMESFHSRKFFPEVIKIATDGIALIVNPQNRDTIVNVEMLKEIFRGNVTRWDELSEGSALGSIRVAFDSPNSSTVRFVLDSICGKGQLSDRCFVCGSNGAVIDYVAETPGALGVIGVNWISNGQDSLCIDFLDRVRVMRVSRSEHPAVHDSFQPYQYYMYTGQYPLLRNVYVLLNDPRSGLPTGLAFFLAGARGQRLVLRSGLLPATMPVNVVNVRDEF